MLKFFKGKKIYSILLGVCPVCHEESMYLESNPYKISKIFDMHECCSHCGTKYKMEPSFFFGAMYVSYGLGIAFAVAAFVIAHLFLGAGLMGSFFAIIGTLVVFMPVIVRLSRNIWINLFLNYNKHALSSKN